MKLKDLKEKEVGLAKILDCDVIESKLSYRIGRLMDKIVGEFRHVEKERQRLLRKYGTLSSDKKTFKFTDEKQKEFEDGINSMMEEEIKLDINKIPFSYLDGKVKLSPMDFINLADFIEPPIEEKKADVLPIKKEASTKEAMEPVKE